jgi:hypothetical protein
MLVLPPGGKTQMRARQLLEGSGVRFSAETTKAMNQAFLNAWAHLSPRYSVGTVQEVEAITMARLKLAECILAVTRDGSTYVAQIERLALEMFQISNY